jgi:probable rRNA maturation factor
VSATLMAKYSGNEESISFPQPEVDEGEDGSPRRLDVSNCHPAYRVNQKVLRSIALEVLRAEKSSYQEIELILLDASEMQRYNAEFHEDDSPTDHLGFQYDAPAGKVSGDIMLCLDVCDDQAREYQQTFNCELARLVIHGILHLCGWQDSSTALRKKMTGREDQLLAILNERKTVNQWLSRGGKND